MSARETQSVDTPRRSALARPVKKPPATLDLESPTEERELQRGLTNRHLQLIALGGAIGTGMFMGSSSTIHLAGPSSALVYALIRAAALCTRGGRGGRLRRAEHGIKLRIKARLRRAHVEQGVALRCFDHRVWKPNFSDHVVYD